MNKILAYIKLKSLTFWAAFLPLLGGLIMSTVELHGATSLAIVVDEMAGDMTAHQLILVGLGGIGLRRAMDKE